MRRLIPALACLAFAGCGASDGKAQKPPAARLSLLSPALQDGAPVPSQFTCDGANQAPPLSWSEPPAGTRSFALVLDDPDAPGGTFRHWGVYDIPAAARALGRLLVSAAPVLAKTELPRAIKDALTSCMVVLVFSASHTLLAMYRDAASSTS